MAMKINTPIRTARDGRIFVSSKIEGSIENSIFFSVPE